MSFSLETHRLRFRRMAPGDLDFVAEMMGDEEVMRFYPKPLHREEAREWIDRQRARYAGDGYGLWLVERRADRRPVGQVGLVKQMVQQVEEAEIGYLIHRSDWRRGYATEAAAGVRDYAFDTLNLSRVVSLIRPLNVPSQGVAARIGMSRQGVMTHGDVEHLVYGLDRAEWARAPRAG